MPGILYIIATPIGNLGDITLRAIETLKKSELILTEDTRVTRKLLMHYKIDIPTLSYHQHSSDNKKLQILAKLVEEKKIALVTDAGTPGISDPGNELINYLLEKEPRIKIVPIPGPSSLTAALSASGFNVNRFFFAGFMPKKSRNKIFTQSKNLKIPLVFFESPKRILKTLDQMIEFFGDNKNVFVARELTKIHETLYRGNLNEVRDQLEADTLKGELVVILEPTK